MHSEMDKCSPPLRASVLWNWSADIALMCCELFHMAGWGAATCLPHDKTLPENISSYAAPPTPTRSNMKAHDTFTGQWL
jgi:hypothetical protein